MADLMPIDHKLNASAYVMLNLGIDVIYGEEMIDKPIFMRFKVESRIKHLYVCSIIGNIQIRKFEYAKFLCLFMFQIYENCLAQKHCY